MLFLEGQDALSSNVALQAPVELSSLESPVTPDKLRRQDKWQPRDCTGI